MHRKSPCRARLCAGMLLAVCAHAQAGSFTTLDDVQGGYVTALSHDGHIVTGVYVSFGTYSGSFVWRQGEGGSTLPLIAASGMSSWAQPIVGSADDGSGNQVAALAYSDVAGGAPVLIGPYPGSSALDNFYSQAYGMSDDGVAVGLAYDPSGNPIAFRWTPADGMARLPVPRPETYSRANGISAAGNVIYGWNDRDDGYRTGVIWVDGSPLEPHNYGMYGDAFGSPPGEPLASTRDGSVVVGQGFYDDLLQSEAWRWTLATDAQPIGVLVPPAARHAMPLQRAFPAGERATLSSVAPSGFFYLVASYAVAVSDDGNTIVGNTGIAPDQVDAFIWTPATGMVFLADYAAAHGVEIPKGFTLYSGSAISGDGLTIAGTGVDPTGTYVQPWIIDLHDAAPQDVVITAQGAIAANDLPAGPFAGFPVGAAVTLRLHVHAQGSTVTPAHASDYTPRAASFALSAHYVDPSDYSRHDASETLDANAVPLLHALNDAPRADGLALDSTPVATAGQTLTFHLQDANGTLFDSDQLTHVNRGFAADQLDGTTVWSVSDGTHTMNVALQFVTVADDLEDVFADGFDGG